MQNNSIESQIHFYIDKNKLKFSPFLETLFIGDYIQKHIKTARIALILCFVLYSIFGILDKVIAPNSIERIWIMRYLIVDPYIAFIFILSFFNIFKRIMPFAIASVVLLSAFGILHMIAVIEEKDGKIFYYAGLILVIMWNYTLVQLRFFHASIVALIITLGYELVAIFFQGVFYLPDSKHAFISNNFFFISSNVIGMFASYLTELRIRKDFLKGLLILEEQKKLKKERNCLQAKNQAMEMELQMARRIQLKIIPDREPTNFISSFYKPMEAVGGDLYDYIHFREANKLGIFLSDVSGHGIPAALITSMIKSIVQQSNQYKMDPAEMLSNLNNMLINQTDNNFVTAFYGIYDSTERNLIYANAGHNLPYLITDNEVKVLPAPQGMPLAVIDNQLLYKKKKNYLNVQESLPVKGKILLYTDGLVETTKKSNPKIFFQDEIIDIMKSYKDKKADEFLLGIYEELVRFHGNSDFDDDVCMICLNII